MEKLTEQEKIRRQKMQDLIDMGIDPFQHFERSVTFMYIYNIDHFCESLRMT